MCIYCYPSCDHETCYSDDISSVEATVAIHDVYYKGLNKTHGLAVGYCKGCKHAIQVD
jgi:hypothetical protein